MEYQERAIELIERLDRLDIIYVRVSTKDKGQLAEDQLPDILDTFKLKKEDCLIIIAEESAYKIDKQKHRVLEVIKEIIEEHEDEEKIMYVWDLDRIYRNAEWQLEFFRFVDKHNGMVLSHRQKFLHELKNMGKFGRSMYRFMIDIFASLAQEESDKKSDRQKKSRTLKEGRLYTNKNNLVGRKLKTLEGKPITKAKQLDKIERYTAMLIHSNTYDYTIKMLKNKGIKISVGYVTKIKKKYGFR